MKKLSRPSVIFLVTIAFLIPGCENSPKFEIKDTSESAKYLSDHIMIKRGEYLVKIAGCRDCHAPIEIWQEPKILISDQRENLTWNEKNFRQVLKEKRYKGLDLTRTLRHPMPWTNYESLSNQDINAIFAYFKSIKPESNDVLFEGSSRHPDN